LRGREGDSVLAHTGGDRESKAGWRAPAPGGGGCPAGGWGRPQLGRSGRAGADGPDGKVGRAVVMVGFSGYTFRKWRRTWAGRQRPVLGWPVGPDWAAIRGLARKGE
jgi:hypothetical protein